ncbi:hypothetical protein ACFXAS_36370, partial [Streptomyces sp. NPDC059459]|uniref:hypothetical protein n=1 Tax=Streptomyces sp. NPDC059459 TaxID=3346839 RepID=UPI0036909D27
YRHDGWSDGTNRWTAGGGGVNVSGGWNIYSTVLSGTTRSFADKPIGSARPTGAVGSVAKRIGRPAPSSHAIAALARIPRAKLKRIRLPQKTGGVISYRRIACDTAGVLRVYEGQVTVAANAPLPVVPFNFVGERFSYKYSFVDESGALRVSAGDITATARGSVQVGAVKLGGSIDGKTLTAQGSAEFVTARVEGEASFNVPGASANAAGHVEGPAARGSAVIGLEGGGAEVGVSAGEIGGKVAVTIGGMSYGVGGEIGLKAEVGLTWGPTSTIKLPLFTITGPNPLAGVTSFAAGAVTDLVRDPLRTTEQAFNDLLGVGEDAVEAVGQVVEFVGEAFDLFSDDEDERSTTTDVFGPRRPPPPGGQNIDY